MKSEYYPDTLNGHSYLIVFLTISLPHFVRLQRYRNIDLSRLSGSSLPLDESESSIAVFISRPVKQWFDSVQILALHRRLRAVLHAHIIWFIGCEALKTNWQSSRIKCKDETCA